MLEPNTTAQFSTSGTAKTEHLKILTFDSCKTMHVIYLWIFNIFLKYFQVCILRHCLL